jgi:hypothetical protein
MTDIRLSQGQRRSKVFFVIAVFHQEKLLTLSALEFSSAVPSNFAALQLLKYRIVIKA